MSRISFIKRGIVSICITLLITGSVWKGTERIFLQYQRDPAFIEQIDQFFPLLVFLGIIGAIYLMTRDSDPLWIQRVRRYLIRIGTFISISVCISIFSNISVRVCIGAVFVLIVGATMSLARQWVVRGVGGCIVGGYTLVILRILIPTYPHTINISQFLLSSPLQIYTFTPGATNDGSNETNELIVYSGASKSTFSLDNARPQERFPLSFLPSSIVYASTDSLRDQRVHFVWRDGSIITLFPQSTIQIQSTGKSLTDAHLIITPKAGKVLITSHKSPQLSSGHLIVWGDNQQSRCFNIKASFNQGSRDMSCDGTSSFTGRDSQALQALWETSKQEIQKIQQTYLQELNKRFDENYGRIPAKIKILLPILELKSSQGAFILPSQYQQQWKQLQVFVAVQQGKNEGSLDEDISNQIQFFRSLIAP